MRYFTFQPQFHDAIRARTKVGTIRAKAKVVRGEPFALRYWTGAPYRSPMGILGTVVCECVLPIIIDNGTLPDITAQKDGFADFDAMLAWFQKAHGLPFHGVLTRWHPDSLVLA